ncbi:MAG: hypothetical protein Ta2G_19040 [Termitinemataceae bacterium]|nr:MAG: hypothetical protein Ta2G_19040 [Termitinemataceae bacterium]
MKILTVILGAFVIIYSVLGIISKIIEIKNRGASGLSE